MAGAKKRSLQTCGHCGIKGHQARTCHVALEDRHPDEWDEVAFRLIPGRSDRDLADDRMRVAQYLRDAQLGKVVNDEAEAEVERLRAYVSQMAHEATQADHALQRLQDLAESTDA